MSVLDNIVASATSAVAGPLNYYSTAIKVGLYLLAGLALMGVGAKLASMHYEPKVSSLQEQVGSLKQQNVQLTSAISEQNQAVSEIQRKMLNTVEMNKRQASQLKEVASKLNAEADLIMKEVEVDCVTSGKEFDAELLQERELK